jgi:hypothetical protein
MASKNYEEPGIVVQAFNPHPRKSEVGGSQVQDQTGLHDEVQSQPEIHSKLISKHHGLGM